MGDVRPTYEQNSDLVNEQSIAARFCTFWSGRIVRPLLPKKLEAKKYRIDFCGIDKARVAHVFWEAKRRFYRFGKYETVFISLDKVIAAQRMWYVSQKPVLFAVEFDEGHFAYADMCYPAERVITIGGRYDRDDAQDEEPLVHIPLDQFTRF